MSCVPVSPLPEVGPFVFQQAGIRASHMVGKYGFTRDDWDDLRQELPLLRCRLWARQERGQLRIGETDYV